MNNRKLTQIKIVMLVIGALLLFQFQNCNDTNRLREIPADEDASVDDGGDGVIKPYVGGTDPCYFDSKRVEHGSTVNGYINSAPWPNSCQQKTRLCTDGNFRGTEFYIFPTCNPAQRANADCLLGNESVTDSHFVDTFQTSKVNPGQECVHESRLCSDGYFSNGSFINKSCIVEALTITCKSPRAQAITCDSDSSVSRSLDKQWITINTDTGAKVNYCVDSLSCQWQNVPSGNFLHQLIVTKEDGSKLKSNYIAISVAGSIDPTLSLECGSIDTYVGTGRTCVVKLRSPAGEPISLNWVDWTQNGVSYAPCANKETCTWSNVSRPSGGVAKIIVKAGKGAKSSDLSGGNFFTSNQLNIDVKSPNLVITCGAVPAINKVARTYLTPTCSASIDGRHILLERGQWRIQNVADVYCEDDWVCTLNIVNIVPKTFLAIYFTGTYGGRSLTSNVFQFNTSL